MLCPTQRTWIISIVCIIGVFVLSHSYSGHIKDGFGNLTATSSPWHPLKTSPSPYATTSPSHPSSRLRSSLRQLFAPILHPPTEAYISSTGDRFEIITPTWPNPLGRKILIVDIDTRVPDKKNQLLSQDGGTIDYDSNEFQGGGDLVTNAVFDHYMYAQIHDYDYKFFQAHSIEGYHDTWILPRVLLQLLEDGKYDFVVTMDADVSVTHPEVPLEFLFNKWGVSHQTSIALPLDVEESEDGKIKTADSKGVQILNTGLVVVQNLPYTKEMLEAWRDCPTEVRYEGCARWKQEWSHEQRAFSEYIRYDFNPQDDNIVTIPCDDAMAFPGMAAQYAGRIVSDCNGRFFRHHTLNKEKTKQSVATSVMQMLYTMMQDSVRDLRDDIWIMEGMDRT